MLGGLVHKALLQRAESDDGQPARCALHELLRQFAAERLDTVPAERALVEARHGAFYLGFVAERDSRLSREAPREAAREIRD